MRDDRTSLAQMGAIVERVVKDKFAGATIDAVSTVKDVDSDGDDILRVTVVFDSKDAVLDPVRMTELVRHLRTALEDSAQPDIFPIVSFVAKREMALLKRETV